MNGNGPSSLTSSLMEWAAGPLTLTGGCYTQIPVRERLTGMAMGFNTPTSIGVVDDTRSNAHVWSMGVRQKTCGYGVRDGGEPARRNYPESSSPQCSLRHTQRPRCEISLSRDNNGQRASQSVATGASVASSSTSPSAAATRSSGRTTSVSSHPWAASSAKSVNG